ncbi:MAG TPA: hypothetical protein VKM55_18925 [Candidatus Lokiarchaeia archaeon]|nr:hypothetical protein [Candidatus Lokiarchaeia archaeon]
MSYRDEDTDYEYNEPETEEDKEMREIESEKRGDGEDAVMPDHEESILHDEVHDIEPACELEPISSTVSGPTCNIMTINLKRDAIQTRAYLLSTENRSYDDYIWQLAEIEARLKPAYITRLDNGTTEIKIDSAKIIDKPSTDEIRILARELGGKQTKIQEIHWFIAERQYVYETAKSWS